ncbi:MAG: N-acetyltransferase family protein, partial [Candidatus Bathyarchaeia archaeon]
WKLRNGQEVLLRPIKPEDEPMWLEMFQSFSEESIRYRFFQMLKDTPHEVRVRYCNIDYDREIAIVAEFKDDHKKILGVGRLSIEPDGKTGELAFIIGDKWQGLGLGTKIVDFVLEIAKEMRVETIYAIMLPDNRKALNLTKKMGFKLDYRSDGTVRGTLDLREETFSEKSPESKTPEQLLEAHKKRKLAPEKETKEDFQPEAGATSS